MIKTATLSLAALLLAGCATTGVIVPPIERPMPIEAMAECLPLTALADSSTQEKSRWIAKFAPEYVECSKRQAELARHIRDGSKK